MSIDITNADIESLAGRLEDGSDHLTLTNEERGLIRAALRRLAAAEITAGRQRQLLELHNASLDQIDGAAREAISLAAAHADGPAPDDGFDHLRAEIDRETLIESIERARSGREVVAASLRLARDAATLLL